MPIALQTRLLRVLAEEPDGTVWAGSVSEGLFQFKEGKLVEIAEYCCYDVKLTKLVHEYGLKHRQLHYRNKFGKKMTVPVKW